MERAPEWDDYARDRAIALLAYESLLCDKCGAYDTFVAADPVETGPARVTWPDGRAIDVRQYRCLACGSVDIVRRDWLEAHEKDKTTPGTASPADGRMFAARPAD